MAMGRRIASLLAVAMVPQAAWAGSSSQASRTAPQAPAIAKSVGDVVGATASSFALVGGVGFVFSAGNNFVRRLPTSAVAAGWGTAQRWGRVSAGFAGGRALGQWVRGADDRWASMAGAVFGGAAAASSIPEIPSSIATFVAFSFVLDNMSPSDAPSKGKQGGDKVQWRGRPISEVRAEAKERAKANYKRRHKDDPVRMRAVR